MKVRLERTFALPGSAQAAWGLLQDIDAVASCMPGAKITERLDDRHFKGTVSVKFGPASMAFRGDVEIVSTDPATMTLQLVGKGTDTTGSSGASMDLTARIEAVDAGACNLLGTSEVSMSGKAAAFGGRMMDSVADQVLKQFAENFAAGVAALSARRTASAPSSISTASVVPAPQITAANPPPSANAGATASAPPRAANELDGISLLWAVIKDWLRRLFGKKAS
jgi:carbon monoxide dehydrogenase subunit G